MFLAAAASITVACAAASSAPGEAATTRDAAADSTGKVPGPALDRSATWGGEHLELVLSDTGATLQYDCAHGTMATVPKPDVSGRFSVSGTHVFEHGGPVRADEPENRHPAEYTGQLIGSTMTLTVRVVAVSATIGPFTLRRGEAGRLNRCL